MTVLLFAYGEALGGVLPEINAMLEKNSNPKRYKNLVGLTLGTGFGGGVVLNGSLLEGDNSAGAEVWCMRNILYPETCAEDSISIRGVRRVYAREAGIEFDDAPQPFDIYEIAMGNKEGNKEAAQAAYKDAVKKIDTAVSKGYVHKNTAARRKSQMTKKLNAAE